MPEIYRTTHNDIPVISSDSDKLLTGTLAIGVGMKDEPAHLAGMSHLVEHLILRSMGELTFMHNAMTGTHTTEFWARGPADEVAEYLNKLMRVVSEAPFSEEDLIKERLVIEAESPANFVPNSGLLTYRYGIEGIGKTHAGAPTLASISIDEARTWIRQWFVVENARLMFTGPPPAELVGTLPAGPIPERRAERRFIDRPSLIPSEKDGIALSLLVDEEHSFLLQFALDFELSRALRTNAALIYSADGNLTNTELGLDQLDYILDPLEQNLVKTLEASVETMRRVARDGFSAEAFEFAKSMAITGISHPAAWWDYVDRLGTYELVGGTVSDPRVWPDEVRRMDAATLTAVLRTALETLVVAHDEDMDLPDGMAAKLDLAEGDMGGNSSATRRGPGKRWRGKGRQIRHWARLDDKDLHTHGSGWTATTPVEDIKIAGKFGDGCLHLFDSWGRNMMIDPGDWRRGESLVDEIIKRLPPEIVRDVSWHDRDVTKKVT